MKGYKNIIWGLLFIIVGIIVFTNSFGITNITIFFDGWWTLFIIIPCAIGLFGENKMGNFIGLIVGVLLYLLCQDFISFDIILKLILPFILILIGLSMIFKNNRIIFIKTFATAFTFISTFIINQISRFEVDRNIFNSLRPVIVNFSSFCTTFRTDMWFNGHFNINLHNIF